jgi:UPF0755 protein
MKRRLRTAGLLALLAILGGVYGIHRLSQPYQGFDGVTFVDLPRGISTTAIAGRLADAGVVRTRWDFLAARLGRRNRALQAGEYRFEGPATCTEVLDRIARGDAFHYTLVMTARFREVWRGLGIAGGPHEIVTLASLVEREGKLAEERPMIAGVFRNRLRLGMKLDCDPTTIYAAQLDGRYRGAIHRSDLDSRNPYNTYQHAGLPPGPIANPGLGSVHAAWHPAHTDALYFVLRPDGSGSHQFSKDIAAHQKAVELYRRGLRKPVR